MGESNERRCENCLAFRAEDEFAGWCELKQVGMRPSDVCSMWRTGPEPPLGGKVDGGTIRQSADGETATLTDASGRVWVPLEDYLRLVRRALR